MAIGEDKVKVEGRENCLEAKEVKEEKDVEVKDIESVSVIFVYKMWSCSEDHWCMYYVCRGLERRRVKEKKVVQRRSS